MPDSNKMPDSKGATVGTTLLAATSRQGRVRYGMLALITVATAINYLDRTNIAIAAPAMARDLALKPATLGILFSTFAMTYAAAQIPCGILLDRIGARISYFSSMTLWSILTALQGLAIGFGSLAPIRLLLGIAEAPAFPTNNRVVTFWFPRSERALATSIYVTGEYVGLAFMSPILIWIMTEWGWRSVFFVSGGLGLICACAWWKFYRDPHESPYLSDTERGYITSGDASLQLVDQQPARWCQALRLLQHRQMWGICIGQFAIASTLYFFLTWFPTYLISARHLSGMRVGFAAMLPFVAATFGVIISGVFSDTLLRSGYSVGFSRGIPIIVGLLLSPAIICANYVHSETAVVVILSFTFFANGLSGISWALVSEVAPADLSGLAGGVFNFAGNLAGIVTPAVIGFIVSATRSFADALVYIGIVALIGALSYLFIIAEIGRVKETQ